jgi:drug/metabolite transporter (DMT)-like permease
MTELNRTRAAWMLTLATLGWGLSFPLTKAFFFAAETVLVNRSTWFHSAFFLVVRFGAAALVLVVARPRLFRELTRAECKQGLGLGLFAAFGLLFQADGLAYTAASTSAFLTQLYCVIIPVVIAIRHRSFPSPITIVSCLIVLAGVGILSNVDWHTLSIGRGELETIISSAFFTGQILWLSRADFRGNDATRMTVVMFGTIVLVLLPVLFRHGPQSADLILAFSTPSIVALLAALTLFCTLLAYCLMNRWQPHVDPTQAGLIYCVEPLFASLFALFLPRWLSNVAGLSYANEVATRNLIIGGSLITIANLLILRHQRREAIDSPAIRAQEEDVSGGDR